MLLSLRAKPLFLRLFSTLSIVLLFLGACSNKKGEEQGESSSLFQPVSGDSKTNLSELASKDGINGGEGDAQVSPEGGKNGEKDKGKSDKDKAEEDEAAFRIIVD